MTPKEFKIHSICVVKNEVDIIEYCLEQASIWSDYIYVYDNGSTDGTWEKVLSLKNDKIIPWKQSDKCFQESLRGEVFNEFRHMAQPGDWWCRLDSDEFYVQSPCDFLAGVHRLNHVVWGVAIEYYLTEEEIKKLDFEQPMSDLLPQIRLYRAENSEPRFFKHRDGLVWSDNGAWPDHVGLVNPERIFYKHYKYRSPHQTQRRLDTRRLSRSRGFPGWDNAVEMSWQEKIQANQDLHYDHQDGDFLIYWSRLPRHREKLPHRVLKLVMHGLKIWA
jgi:glycosyltransferase involved in cell wall biosynthesis